MYLSFLLKQFKTLSMLALGLIVTLGFNSVGVLAAPLDTTNLTQAINAGTLSIEFVDSSYVAVPTPNVNMTSAIFSFSPQTATGSLGTNNERIYWTNPDAADGGYVITMAATAGTTSCWDEVNGGGGGFGGGLFGTCGPGDYDFNDPGAVLDGADADALAGQLTVDPSTGTITARTGTTTGMTLGSSNAFSETGAIVTSITLLTAAAGADDISSTYVTGIGLSQLIPAQQPAGTYTINMTVTIT